MTIVVFKIQQLKGTLNGQTRYYLIWQQQFLQLRKVNKTIKGFSLWSSVRRPSVSKPEKTTYFRYHFNLSKTNTRNKTRMLGLRKGELTKTGIQVKARGSCPFPPSTPSQCPNLSITWTWVITKDPPGRVSLPQFPSQATRTQQNPLAAQILCCQVFSAAQPTQLFLPPFGE